MSDDPTQTADPAAGTTTPLTEEQERIQRARMAKGIPVDDTAASHQGGMGAQGGQADYGSAGNLAGGLAQS